MDAVHVPMLVFSPTDPRVPVSMANTAAETLLGKEQDQLLKLTFDALFAPEDRDRAAAMASVLSDPAGHRLLEESEMQVLKKSGRKLAVKVTASTLRFKGEPLILLCLSDLSEQKRLQNERENAIKEVSRVSKLADIGQLVAGVAHELNNPLTVIQGFAENIEMLLSSPELNKDELSLQLSPILKATERMARIISRMMRMVRQDDVRMTDVDLRDVVQDALHFMHHRLDDFGIEVANELTDRLSARCDPNQVEQILLNLISNAIHALRKNKDARIIRISAQADDETVRLHVFNNGPPIPPEIRDRVMSPFFTTKPVGEGTGLGLALSYGIMKAHGGNLDFKSSKRHGTEFTLTFPAPPANAQALGTAVGTVIVCDDNEFSRRGLAGKLSRYGYTVIEAKDGDELSRALHAHPETECVFTELYLPRATPSLLVPEIHRLAPKAQIFVLTDERSGKAHDLPILRQGVNGLLTKPIDQENFAAVLKQLEKRKPAA